MRIFHDTRCAGLDPAFCSKREGRSEKMKKGLNSQDYVGDTKRTTCEKGNFRPLNLKFYQSLPLMVTRKIFMWKRYYFLCIQIPHKNFLALIMSHLLDTCVETIADLRNCFVFSPFCNDPFCSNLILILQLLSHNVFGKNHAFSKNTSFC